MDDRGNDKLGHDDGCNLVGVEKGLGLDMGFNIGKKIATEKEEINDLNARDFPKDVSKRKQLRT